MIELYVIRRDELVLIKPLEERLTIGSDAKCDISLRGTISPMHASLEVAGDKLTLKELGGTVYFNGQPIKSTVTLKAKDIFDLGEYRFQINRKTKTDRSVISRTLTATHNTSGTVADDALPVITLLKPQKKSFCQLNILIGRGASCDLKIPDEAITRKNVSRRHAEIYAKNGKYFIRDLQSKNGTTLYDYSVDGRPLPRGGTLCLGRYELPYVIEDPTSTALKEEGIEIPSLNANLGSKRMIGSSPAMQVLKEKLDRSLPGTHTVLILGENGTGKDLCARYLHFYHPERKKGPFVAINCAAVPKQLAESSLFGHVKGAFTGAVDHSQGVFQQAHGGTLFLDEVGELPLEIQAQLLRVLEDGLIRPVGSNKEKAVDVRVVFATNRDIDEERRTGKFRDDLYYRCQNTIRVPSLRERKSDIRQLVDHFLSNSGKPLEIVPQALSALETYPWPGNVRELASAIERAILNVSFRGASVIMEHDLELESDVSVYTSNNVEETPDLMKEQIIQLLKKSKGKVSHVAQELSLDRKSFYRKMKAFNINPKTFRM